MRSAIEKQDTTVIQVQLCKKEILRLDVEVKNGINEIREATGATEVTLNRMVQEVKEKMKEIKERIEELESISNQVRKPNERDELRGEVKKHRAETELSLENLRKSNTSRHADDPSGVEKRFVIRGHR